MATAVDPTAGLSKQATEILMARSSPLHVAKYYRDHYRYPYAFPKHLKLFNSLIKKITAPGSKERNLIINVAPRYGKSEYMNVWVPLWYLGRNPFRNIILATHEASLSSKFAVKTREIIKQVGEPLFSMKIHREVARDWTVAHAVTPDTVQNGMTLQDPGGYLAIGLGGPVAGRGCHLFITDDPYKNAAQAFSVAYRDMVYDFIHGTVLNRVEPGGKAVIMMHRWHTDDICGRLLREHPDQWQVVSLPELATPGKDDPDPLGRKWGEPLWPERWPYDSILEKKEGMSTYFWEALHQQNPPKPGGAMFQRHMFIWEQDMPLFVGRRVRAWDLAAGGEAFTVGVRAGWIAGEKRGVDDVIRENLEIGQVFDMVKATAKMDGPHTVIRVEQEGGSQGALSIEQLKRDLRGFDVEGIPKRQKKIVEWEYAAGFFQNGDVVCKSAPWNADFVDELTRLPTAPTVDQGDALALAFRTLDAMGSGSPRLRLL